MLGLGILAWPLGQIKCTNQQGISPPPPLPHRSPIIPSRNPRRELGETRTVKTRSERKARIVKLMGKEIEVPAKTAKKLVKIQVVKSS